MKKIIGTVVALILASLALAAPAVGQSQSLFYGEYHNYSVTFKEDGEAVIFAKLVFTNSTDKDQKTYTFSAKDTGLKELGILQVKLPKECADYTQIYDSTLGRNTCARYRDPDYNSYYYYSYGASEEITYRRAEISNDGLDYTVTLPEVLKPEKTTALLLAYTSTEYTKESLLAKKYDFPTLKIGNRITESKVGVSVDEGLTLEGVTTPTYCTMGMCPVTVSKDVSVSTIGNAGSISSAPVTNRSLDNLYASIGNGQRTYQAKSITPNKSFIASGRYATSEIRLNAQSIGITLTIVAFVLIVLVLVSIKFKGQSRVNNAKGKWNNLRLLSNMVPVASLLPMASLITGTWYISTDNFANNVWNGVNGAGKSFVVVFIVLLYAVLVSISPVVYAIRSGWRAMLSVIIMQAIWGTLLLAIILPFMIFSK